MLTKFKCGNNVPVNSESGLSVIPYSFKVS